MNFEYSIIRYVPDSARGEFVNLGILVGGPHGWTLRHFVDQKRVAHLVHGTEFLRGAKGFVKRLEREVTNMEGRLALADGDWLHDLAGAHRQIIQVTAPTPVVGADLEVVADILATELLSSTIPKRLGVTRSVARASLRRSLIALQNEFDTQMSLEERVMLVAEGDQQIMMDFAVRNGRVQQLSHAFSFQSNKTSDRVDQQVKAWAWVVDNLKTNGGYLDVGGNDRVEVDSGVDIEVYVVPPVGGSQEFERSLKTFDQLEVVVETVPAAIANRARELVADSH